MRNFKEFGKDMNQRKRRLVKELSAPIPSAIGKMLVDGFRQSFQLQKFNDAGGQPWKQVKRRTRGDAWFGFSLNTNAKMPKGARGTHQSGSPRRFGTYGGKTNYSPAATTRGILRGKGSTGLALSIRVMEARLGRVAVGSSKPYAQVHNEGGDAKIFGRKSFKMPKRQFMGDSDLLRAKALKIIDKEITKILDNE